MSHHDHLIVFTDGGARGNPGPAALGVVIKTPAGETVEAFGEYLGETTNNQAEYRAVIAGIQKAKSLGATALDIYMDSELVVRQMTGEYRVKDPDLANLYLRIHNEKIGLKRTVFHHVPREKNSEADKMVNEALDRHLKNS